MKLTNITRVSPEPIMGLNWECSSLEVLDDGSVWVVYRTAPDGELHLMQIGGRDHRLVQLPPSPDHPNGYHGNPSLVRDHAGGLTVFCTYPHEGYRSRYQRYRIDVLDRPVPMHPVRDVPSKILGGSMTFHDVSGWYDPSTKRTWIVGEGAKIYGLPFWRRPTTGGLDRTCFLMDEQGTLGSPFNLVEAQSHQPEWADQPGNEFVKGDCAHGYVFWTVRNTFQHGGNSVGHCTGLYGARVLSRGAVAPLIPGADRYRIGTRGIPAKSERFLIWPGDVRQSAGRGFTVDAQGNPWVVFKCLQDADGAPLMAGATDHTNDAIPQGRWDYHILQYDPDDGWLDIIQEEHVERKGDNMRLIFDNDWVSGRSPHGEGYWIRPGPQMSLEVVDLLGLNPTELIGPTPNGSWPGAQVSGLIGLYRGRPGVNPRILWQEHIGKRLWCAEVSWT